MTSQPGIGLILGSLAYGEADRIVRILTPSGPLSFFARGARRSQKRFGGALEPFSSVSFVTKPRRAPSRLPELREVSVKRPRLGLQTRLETIWEAGYLCELFGRMAPEGEESKALLEALETALDKLAEGRFQLYHRRQLELWLLAFSGYRPVLSAGCEACQRPLGPEAYLDLGRGALFCEAHRGSGVLIGPKTRAFLEAALGAGVACPPWTEADAERAARCLERPIRLFFSGFFSKPFSFTQGQHACPPSQDCASK